MKKFLTLLAFIGIVSLTAFVMTVATSKQSRIANLPAAALLPASQAPIAQNTVELRTTVAPRAPLPQVSISGSYSSMTPIVDRGIMRAVQVSLNFTLTNAGKMPIYISKSPFYSVSTSTAGSTITAPAASSTLVFINTSPDTMASDTPATFIVPPGTSRTFDYSGWINNTNGKHGIRAFRITGIRFGLSPQNPILYTIAKDPSLPGVTVTF